MDKRGEGKRNKGEYRGGKRNEKGEKAEEQKRGVHCPGIMGIGRQDVEFWNYRAKKDFIYLYETWKRNDGTELGVVCQE